MGAEHAGNAPPLCRRAYDADDHAPLPEFGSEDHFRLAEWVKGALRVAELRGRDHLDAVVGDLQRQVNDVTTAVSLLAQRDEDNIKIREKMAEQLESISAALNQVLGSLSVDKDQRGWFTPRQMPILLATAVFLFSCALVWGVIFGDASVLRSIDKVRGLTPAQQEEPK